jgi:hypothetical protein
MKKNNNKSIFISTVSIHDTTVYIALFKGAGRFSFHLVDAYTYALPFSCMVEGKIGNFYGLATYLHSLISQFHFFSISHSACAFSDAAPILDYVSEDLSPSAQKADQSTCTYWLTMPQGVSVDPIGWAIKEKYIWREKLLFDFLNISPLVHTVHSAAVLHALGDYGLGGDSAIAQAHPFDAKSVTTYLQNKGLHATLTEGYDLYSTVVHKGLALMGFMTYEHIKLC